ncbi:ribonuclease Z [Gemmatimonadota bacterium]
MRITFLGTAAARPTVGRGVSGLAVQREGDLFLFDCGEGTQRQMMRFGTGFGVQAVFVTHLHADHFLGLIGLLRTLALQGREEAIRLFGPRGSKGILHQAVHLGVDRLPFPITVEELAPGEPVCFREFDVVPFAVHHGTSAVGLALKEHPRLGRFDVNRARALGIPEGPLFGRLHQGEPVEVNGRIVESAEVVGNPRPGRLVAYTGDTRPTSSTLEAARGADLLIHEATFGEEESQRAHETFHATARGAALLAREAEVARLILTHISARYSENPVPLLEEARGVFRPTQVAYDGMTVELGYGRDSAEENGLGQEAEEPAGEGKMPDG